MKINDVTRKLIFHLKPKVFLLYFVKTSGGKSLAHYGQEKLDSFSHILQISCLTKVRSLK